MENTHIQSIVLNSVWKWWSRFYPFLTVLEWCCQTNIACEGQIYTSRQRLPASWQAWQGAFLATFWENTKAMECAIDSTVRPQSYNVWTSQEPPPIINMDFFKPPELGLVPLAHSLGTLTLIQNLPLRPAGHGVYGLSKTGLFLLVTCWPISHWSDSPPLQKHLNAATNASLSWALAPSLFLFVFQNQNRQGLILLSKQIYNSYSPLPFWQQQALLTIPSFT